ncbi:site-2 protease family protein [Streptomyces heilongjiangensis]|uniref:Site-2 protease family protein n=1 Tax=Streptomyces heilongjiangensis TaxID=945052 RepID=A0ABW1B8K6_9ACTN|nr:site-2 protease family protein [Streptomyces heilongjiangensis]MDC2946712.1 site-2 protease family protein [Streptomyces heilongjiangensis]
METSGGSGQPRSGNDDATEHTNGDRTHTADTAPTEPTAPTPEGTPTPPRQPQATGDTEPSDPTDEAGTGAHTTGETEEQDTAENARPLQPATGAAEPREPETPEDYQDHGNHGDTGRPGGTEHPSPSADARPAEPPHPADAPQRTAGALPPEDHRPTADTPTENADENAGRPDAPHPAAAPTSLHKGPSTGSPAGSSPGSQHTTGTARPHAHGGPKPPERPKEPGGGILMGRPFGVPVYVAPSWFLVAALITWVFGGQLDRVLPELGALRYLVSLFFAVAFYASVLVHELAHTIAALRFKLPVRRIQLQFFGGVSEIEKESETPGREFVLAFVGPLLSLVLAGAFYLALLAVEPGTVPGVLLAGLMISNLIVAAFNLLPGLPLDGGRMLRAVVWKITGKPMSGTIAAAWVGRALALSVLIGLPWLTQSGLLGADATDSVGMDTVLDALLAAILAAIIWTGAGNSLRMARLREHLPELRARALTRRAVPVQTDTPLSEALRRANDAGARALVVVDADGEPLSLVREAAIVGVPEHRRPWVAVSGLAQDLTDGMRVSAELAGEELLDALRATPATEYLVVEDTGEIYGVLSAADVERAFVKAMARPS